MGKKIELRWFIRNGNNILQFRTALNKFEWSDWEDVL